MRHFDRTTYRGSNLSVAAVALVAALLPAAALASGPSLAKRVRAIVGRPEFRHATFGVEFYDLAKGKVVYELNGDKLFTPASTTKLLTMGTAEALLGPDYRFHTRVYRTGPLTAEGTLQGDLVLVASGDPNLSNRIQPGGTLAFENEDHAYAGSPDTKAVPGDPLLVIRELAAQVAARGIKRIDGHVLVDVSLFPEGEPELGTGLVLSPIVVNDNMLDVTAGPSTSVSAPVELHVSPETSYVTFVNQAKTGPADAKPDIEFVNDVARPDGTHSVTVTGTMPLGKPSILFAYGVPQPSRFAEVVLAEALQGAGVSVSTTPPAARPEARSLAANYTPDRLVAEHGSPSFSEEVKVTLKVSQNLHASMMPYLLGALVAHKQTEIPQAGFDLERGFLEKAAGLDLSGASQGDGAGGSPAGCYTPDFMVHYLEYWSRQKDFPLFLQALPILGHDGTLWNIQVSSPAAGHVQAKTGTLVFYNALDRNLMVTGKGLAGYITSPSGRRWAFAAYVNHLPVPNDPEAVTRIVGQVMGEIANAGYAAMLEGE